MMINQDIYVYIYINILVIHPRSQNVEISKHPHYSGNMFENSRMIISAHRL